MKKEMAIQALSKKVEPEAFEPKAVLTIEDLYNNYKADCWAQINEIVSQKKFITSKGRSHFIFPLLERNGILTWQDVSREAELIDMGTSPLSSNVRNAINHLHTHCLIMFAKRQENDGE